MNKGCIITTEDGKRWRLLGDEPFSPEEGYALSYRGVSRHFEGLGLPVVPVLDTVTFDGVVFERMGKMGRPIEGRWYLDNDHGRPFVAQPGTYASGYELLRPVRVEGQGNNPT